MNATKETEEKKKMSWKRIKWIQIAWSEMYAINSMGPNGIARKKNKATQENNMQLQPKITAN